MRQRISEPPLSTCEKCGGAVKRLLSPAPFILKGAGWYVTDYPSESRKKALASEKSSGDGAKKESTSTEKPAAEKASTPDSSSTSTSSSSPTPSKSSTD